LTFPRFLIAADPTQPNPEDRQSTVKVAPQASGKIDSKSNVIPLPAFDTSRSAAAGRIIVAP
jgi:hypothetical protein